MPKAEEEEGASHVKDPVALKRLHEKLPLPRGLTQNIFGSSRANINNIAASQLCQELPAMHQNFFPRLDSFHTRSPPPTTNFNFHLRPNEVDNKNFNNINSLNNLKFKDLNNLRPQNKTTTTSNKFFFNSDNTNLLSSAKLQLPIKSSESKHSSSDINHINNLKLNVDSSTTNFNKNTRGRKAEDLKERKLSSEATTAEPSPDLKLSEDPALILST